MPLTAEDVAAIETVAHYTHDEDQCYLMLYGEGVFDTIPIEADYTVGDMKLWLKTHKNKDPAEYDLVGPKGVWKMGAGSEVLGDDIIIADVMGPRFEGKWLMQVHAHAPLRNVCFRRRLPPIPPLTTLPHLSPTPPTAALPLPEEEE